VLNFEGFLLTVVFVPRGKSSS